MARIKIITAVFVALLLGLPAVAEEVKLYNAADTCGAATAEGAIAYDDATDTFKACDGSAWADLASMVGTGGGGVWSVSSTDVYRASGNVGIGTSDPSETLHVIGDVRFDGQLRSSSTDVIFHNPSGARNSIDIRGVDIGLSTASPVYGEIESSATYDIHFNIDDSTKMSILDSGNVGIGTTTPAYTLDVSGTGKVGGIYLSSGGTAKISLDGTDGAMSAAEVAIFEAGGSLNLSTRGTVQVFLDNDDSQTNTAFTIGTDGSGSNLFRVNETGEVGIGTTSPSYTLDVSGTANISGAVTAASFTGDGSGLTGVSMVGGIDDLSDAVHNVTDKNIFIGHEGGAAGSNNIENVAIGVNALDALSNSAGANEGDANVAIGYSALTANTTGYDNVAVGHSALSSNLTGTRSIAIGRLALGANTVGHSNVAIGYASLFKTTASENIAIGYAAGIYNSSGAKNFIGGHRAGLGVDGSTITNNSVMLGYHAGYAVTTADNNTFVGYQAGDSVTTGDNNILLGYDVDTPAATTSNHLNIGDTIYGDLSTDKIGIGVVAPTTALDVSGTVTATAFAGDGSGLTGVPAASMGIDDLTDAKHDTDDYSSLFIGSGAGANDDGTDNKNIGIGRNALNANTTGGSNIAIGQYSLDANTLGIRNLAIGQGTLGNSVSGNNNIAIGFNSLHKSTGSSNTAVGHSALYYSTGQSSVAIGRDAGYGVDGATVVNNSVMLGYNAGFAVTTADNNTFVGYQAGNSVTTGDNNILLGYDVDTPTATTSNHLNIGNTIYGDLSTGRVGIGTTTPAYTLDVSGTAGLSSGSTWTNTSDARLKDVGNEYVKGLEEVSQLRPVHFRYKEDNIRGLNSDTLQIGFVAQEVQNVFPEAVNTGEDGFLDFNMHSVNVAVINAIKELKAQNEAMAAEIKALKEQLNNAE